MRSRAIGKGRRDPASIVAIRTDKSSSEAEVNARLMRSQPAVYAISQQENPVGPLADAKRVLP